MLKIDPQATATVRLTKMAAERLKTFLSGLASEPRNANDALNIALSSLPTESFMDEYMALEADRQGSLVRIRKNFIATGHLPKAEWYFLVMVAKDAVLANESPEVKTSVVATVLGITLALWRLIEAKDTDGHQERYLKGNLGQLPGMAAHAVPMGLTELLEHYLPILERDEPRWSSLDFAIRNPEVLLRDDLRSHADAEISNVLSPYFRPLFRMAVRWVFQTTGRALDATAAAAFVEGYSGFYGAENCLHVAQKSDGNIGFILSIPGDRWLAMAANNVAEVEDVVAGFRQMRFAENDEHYSAPQISITRSLAGGPRHSAERRYMIGLGSVRFWIDAETFDVVADALEAFASNPDAQKALEKAYDQFGEL